jgi:hypothetical protein
MSSRDGVRGGATTVHDATKLIAAAAVAVGALALLASVRDGVVDAGADVLVVVSLLSLSRTAFDLVGNGESNAQGRDEPRQR